MRKLGWAVWISSGWLIVAANVHGEWHDWWDRWGTDFHRMNCWPEPFVSYDRQAARATFEPFIEAGWRTENTLLDPLFDSNGQLTRAGKLRVREILMQYPPHRRALYIAAGATAEETQRRVDSVTQYAQTLTDQSIVVPVSVNFRVPRSGTGDYLNLVSERYRQNLPAPVLPRSGQAADSGQSSGVSGSP